MDNDYIQYIEEETKEPLPLSIFFAALFVFGAVSVSVLPGFNYLVVGFGVLSAVACLMAALRTGFLLSPELKMYLLFFTWAMLGFIVAKYPYYFFEKIRTLFQFVIMVVVVSFYAKNVRCVSILLAALFIGIMIVGVSAILTGDFQRAEISEEDARAAGFVMNANTFAIVITYGLMVLLYYFRAFRSWLIKAGIIVLLLAAVRFVIASGSRSGFICMGLLLASWFFFTYRKEIFHRPQVAIAALLMVVAIGGYASFRMKDSLLLRRFVTAEEALTTGGGEGSTTSRMMMVKEGLSIISENPLVGVGLGHFIFHSKTEKYAHNNYIEIFASTGIPGGICYYAIYVIILLRLHRLSRHELTFKQKQLLNIFTAYMAVRMIHDLAGVSYYAKPEWVILAIIIGFTYSLQHELAERQVASEADFDEASYSMPQENS
jgi:O-antigen ligase